MKEMKPLINQAFYASGRVEGLKLGHDLIARFLNLYIDSNMPLASP